MSSLNGFEFESEELTPIQKFFDGKSVFLTGGTGFLGKVLTEKLLRSCPGLDKIYLLIRGKKNKGPEERYEGISSDVLYDEVRKQNPKFLSKIVLIPGDCAEPNLGISEEHRKLLTENVNVVIHAAASVRFDECLKLAIATNVYATKDLVKLCHSMEKIESFVYVSTAYSRCYAKHVTEDFEEWKPEYEDMISRCNGLTEKEVDEKLKSLWSKWPNTYTFTKTMAECYVKREEGRLPSCIFRPGVVGATMTEPLPGWIDNLLVPTGLIAGAQCGIIRVVLGDQTIEPNIVPVDLVSNGILAAAYDTAQKYKNDEKQIKAYNYSSSADNPVTFRMLVDNLHRYGVKIPSTKAIWYYTFYICKSKPLYYILSLFVHWLPALLIDTLSVASGRKPVMLKLYAKVEKFIGALGYFSLDKLKFDTNNTNSLWDRTSESDKRIFNFDLKSIEWEKYTKSYITGTRVYVLKDDLNTVEVALKRWRRLYWYHQIVKLAFTILGFTILWLIFRKMSSLIAN